MTRGRPDDQKLQVMLIIARNGQDRDLEIGLRERMNIPDVPCLPLLKRKSQKLLNSNFQLKSKLIRNTERFNILILNGFVLDWLGP